MTLADILEQAKALTPQEQKELTKHLIDMIAFDQPPPKRKLSELRGLGKQAWQSIDAQEYVDQMRDEWDED